jgi:signal peptidase I
MKRFMQIGGKAVTGLFVIFLLFALYFVVSAKVSGGEPKVFGKQMMMVLSGSMSPVFETGALIAVDPTGPTHPYAVGDVITFKSPDDPNKIITHRVVEVQTKDGQRSYVTKGDANDSKDPKPVMPTSVIGQYADFHIPLLGYVFSFVKTKLGIALVLIVPGAFLIISQLVAVYRSILRMEKAKEAAVATQEVEVSEH